MEERNSIKGYQQSKSFSRMADLFDPAFFVLLAGVGLSFFRFLWSRGICSEENLVVLSSKDHFSCDRDELRNVRILVNLRKLNLIKHLDVFLSALVRILPPDTSFVGYFSDEKSGRVSPFNVFRMIFPFRRLLGRPDSGRKHSMNRDEVMDLLWKNGFKTIAMKEINGHTYFISQNMQSI
jgi:hypothetical protein